MKRQRYPNLAARILANTVEDSSLEFCKQYGACYLWTLCRDRKGYGRLSVRVPGKRYPVLLHVHRVAFEIFTGRKIPDNMTLDHGCEREHCWRPSHLAVVTRSINTHMAWARRRYQMRNVAYDTVFDCVLAWERLRAISTGSFQETASSPP